MALINEVNSLDSLFVDYVEALNGLCAVESYSILFKLGLFDISFDFVFIILGVMFVNIMSCWQGLSAKLKSPALLEDMFSDPVVFSINFEFKSVNF